MQQSSSIATATGTQIWPYYKMVKGHPSLNCENWSSGFREEDIYRFQGFIPVYSTGAKADNPKGVGGWNFYPN